MKHTWEPLFAPKLCTWIGLNPSVGAEAFFDHSLRRIRAFSSSWGYNGFIMTNLFALVSTDPKGLYFAQDPVGPENDRYILQAVQETKVVIAAWGLIGLYRNRSRTVLEMLSGFDIICLRKTKGGSPIHPLYVDGNTKPTRYEPAALDRTKKSG